ncbi:RNA polymerase sigma-I factor [Ammoniphilus oxalaticus]|uniref:RNA polymerase sigma-I factor n=1 Tax=Ammoniphilus oxalaticus TaxID=66863 RepID=UPI001FE885DE|nr:RNA polymerase sigma-I factor [Ammoniphilus oxalaticus]
MSRFIGRRSSNPSFTGRDLTSEVVFAQQGDVETRNELLRQYTPFISQVAAKVCKRYIDPKQDDEFSVALEAFDEAITNYSEGKGSSFLSFANLVIRRRIIDYIRKEARHRGSLAFEHTIEGEEDSDQSPVEVQASLEQYQLDYESSLRREEIQHYKEKLEEYKIDLMELPDLSPKHVDARRNAISIASIVANNSQLRNSFLATKKLPMKELMGHVKVSRKTVERNRTYIVAVILLLVDDYRYLHDYLNIEPESERGERIEEGHRDAGY